MAKQLGNAIRGSAWASVSLASPLSRPEPNAIETPSETSNPICTRGAVADGLHRWQQIIPTCIAEKVFSLQDVVASRNGIPNDCGGCAGHRDGLNGERENREARVAAEVGSVRVANCD